MPLAPFISGMSCPMFCSVSAVCFLVLHQMMMTHVVGHAPVDAWQAVNPDALTSLDKVFASVSHHRCLLPPSPSPAWTSLPASPPSHRPAAAASQPVHRPTALLLLPASPPPHRPATAASQSTALLLLPASPPPHRPAATASQSTALLLLPPRAGLAGQPHRAAGHQVPACNPAGHADADDEAGRPARCAG